MTDDLDTFFRALSTNDLLTGEVEREAFKAEHRARRRDLDRYPFVQLDRHAAAPELVSLRNRRSERLFSSRPVGFRDLSSLLAALSPVETAGGPVFRYASAGGAYAVQVYVQAHPQRVEGVPAGLYYHRPDHRRLLFVSDDLAIRSSDHFPANRSWADRGAFTILLVADLSAIRPLYGQKARDFCLVETGEMVQLLQSAASALGVGLCQSGAADFTHVRARLALGADHDVLAALVGGAVERSPMPAHPERPAFQRPPPQRQALPPSRPMMAADACAMAPLAAPPTLPAGSVEAELSVLWKSLLSTETLDPTALFFDVGATSIMAARAARQLQERYPNVEIDVADIFAYPSVRELAIFLTRKIPAAAFVTRPPDSVSAPDSKAAAAPPPPHFEVAGAAAPALQSPTVFAVEPVAVVGMALRVSGASTPDAFWTLLSDGICRVGPQPEERRALVPAFRPREDQSFVASYLADVDAFDPLFFHMSPREAERVEPAQRLMLEVAADLLASSGYFGGQLSGTRTGVFIGASRGSYADLRDRSAADLSRLLPGNMAAIIANRISHFFNLSGPSVVIDTACSSSLMAVDQAVHAIQSADVDAAIAGGVNLLLSAETFEAFRQDGMESLSGLCRTFDAGADGFVRGEGAAAVLLKPLSAAIRDGDHVFALIRGSASNHDGRTSSLPVPSPIAQRDVIELAHKRAATTPAEIDYVEVHGTGTRLGDPIEVRGLTDAFRKGADRPGHCAVGSVKTNLGHLEFAAGIVGLVKTVLALERGILPPSLHFQEPNPHIDFSSTPFWVVDRRRPWPARGRPRRAAVSSFGVGGTNVHVVLEQAPPVAPPPSEWERPVHLVVLSAPDAPSLAGAITSLLEHVERHPAIEVPALAYTLAVGRPELEHRAAFVVRDRDQLIDRLSLAVVAPGRGRTPGVFIGAVAEEPRLAPDATARMNTMFPELTDGGQRALRHYARDERLTAMFGLPIEEDVPPPAALCRAGWVDLFTALAELWVMGFAVDLRAIDAAFPRTRVVAPALSLRRQRYWWSSTPETPETPELKLGSTVKATVRATVAAPREEPLTAAPAPDPIGILDGITSLLRERVGSALHIDPEWIDPRHPLVEMGMDSLAATELIKAVSDATGHQLDTSFFFEHATIEKLAQALVARGVNSIARPVHPAPAAAVELPAVRRAAPPPGGDTKIAVTGMAGRLPGAADLAAFWENLSAGRDSVTEVPRSRFDIDAIYDPDPRSTRGSRGRWGAFLDGIDRFDPRFFRISEREARSMDPQQRLLLMTVWEAVEDAGLTRVLGGTRTGVYVGASHTHHRDKLNHQGTEPDDAYVIIDSDNAILANRVSYFLDLHGPCSTINTLCSSSSVALHSAVRALRSGEIDRAIVAGVHVALSPLYYQTLSRLGALSPDGRCRTFDEGANGYVPGEGVVAVVLEPLGRAIANGAQVHAVILGSAVNHGGQSAGLTVPNPAAQGEVVRAALADAGVAGDSLSYVEAHGTGTSIGDPIELNGLQIALSQGTTRRQFCGVGSLKSNIGHLEPAAGLASLLKVILAMKHRVLPPTLHVLEPNKAILFEDGPCYVVDRARPWRADGPRRAGVSSFGLGGTNAHVIVEEAPPVAPRTAEPALPSLFLISGKDERALHAQVDRCLAFVRAEGRTHALVDLCFSATEGRAYFPYRAAIVAADVASLEHQLSEAARLIRKGAPLNPPAGATAADTLGRDFLNGLDIDASGLFAGARRVSIPTYPFEDRELGQRRDKTPGPATHPFASILEPVSGSSPGSTTIQVRVDVGELA